MNNTIKKTSQAAVVHLSDIPVYRIDEDVYYNNERERSWQTYKEKNISPVSDANEFEKLFELFERDFASKSGGWEYNEIVGYIRLHFCGHQIRAEYYRMAGMLKRKTRKKLFVFKEYKLIQEVDVPISASNDEIFELILKHLLDCKIKLQNLHIDDRHITLVGPYVDWRLLLENEVI